VRHVHSGKHEVDLALLQELHAVCRHYRLKLKPDAEPIGHVLGEVGLEAHDAAARIAKAERLVVGLGADHQNAPLLDLVEGLSRKRSRRNKCTDSCENSDHERALQHRSLQYRFNPFTSNLTANV